MEKASTSTVYHSDFSSTDAIVFFLYNVLILWVTSLHKLSFGILCLPHVCKSRSPVETTTSVTTNTNSKRSELELSREDLEMVMQKMGISEEMKREQMKEKIEFEEVSDIFQEKEPSLEEAKEAFSVFDSNSDGFIDASELQRVLSELGFKAEVGLDECQGMIEVYDENKDGRIDFNEFLKFLERSFC
ncbi:Calcium-binding EF hand family protein [Rhynchospora pubera]|uniref:Calcium-binding EF hand family protein n=1 Tax=Rhynchospora pubera TaxID=906938 RepID=A0AAV8BS43_9POAL|nr:Calcium-binding EF hand family protein [Rhynchospora pubera]